MYSDTVIHLSRPTPATYNLIYFSESPCQCGVTNAPTKQITDRIINGQEALPNEFPWQVALVRAGGHSPICGGSVISDRHVLTAAHCTADIKGT